MVADVLGEKVGCFGGFAEQEGGGDDGEKKRSEGTSVHTIYHNYLLF